MEAEIMERFRQIYAMLEDDESKDIYINRLNYLITGRMHYMKKIIDKYFLGINDADWIKALPKDKPIILYGGGRTV